VNEIIAKLLYILSIKEKYALIKIFILIAILSVCEAISVGVMWPFTSLITGTGHIEDNKYLSVIYNYLKIDSVYYAILATGIFVFIIFVLKSTLTVLVHYNKLYFVNFSRVEIGKRIVEDILGKD